MLNRGNFPNYKYHHALFARLFAVSCYLFKTCHSFDGKGIRSSQVYQIYVTSFIDIVL